MAASKTSATETVVAIGAVVFVFSVVGIIALGPSLENPVSYTGVSSESAASGAAPAEVVADAAFEEVADAAAVLDSGTALAPATSQFNVEM